MLDLGKRPITHQWSWSVLLDIASSGYVRGCHVSAYGGDSTDPLVGIASCEVKLHDSVNEVIECLAIESMMAATEPQLDGSPSHRRVVFSSNL